ncbi:MAG: DtxR family transcriptional regulator [Desulfitobacterium sp.]|nr:DtxR family transcriptional regulator [Desulfitobacterium sp.]
MEDYLEMAYRLCQEKGYTRVGKISEKLHVKPASASKMLSRLRELDYLEYDTYESIRLTSKGEELGEYLMKRHQIVEDFLQLIGSTNSLLETELVEHSLSPETVSKLSRLVEFFESDRESKKKFEAYREKYEESEKRHS